MAYPGIMIMRKKLDIKTLSAMARFYAKGFAGRYKEAALASQARHNKCHPKDKWIRYGTYARKIEIWVPWEDAFITIEVRVVRFLSKATGKTCSFQGGYLLQRTRYAGLALLEFAARYMRHELKDSFEISCVHEMLAPAMAKRVMQALRSYLGAVGATGRLTASQDTFSFLETFLDDLWSVSGNPFCSEMEARMF